MLSADNRHVRLAVFADEQCIPYDRVQLSKALTGADGGIDLTLGGGTVWEDPRVELRLGVEADGSVAGYGELVLTTRSDAARLDVPGAHRALVFRTLDDVAAIPGRGGTAARPPRAHSPRRGDRRRTAGSGGRRRAPVTRRGGHRGALPQVAHERPARRGRRTLPQRPDLVVSRSQLLSAVPGLDTEHALEMVVSRLCKALPVPLVATVIKRGYRLGP